MKNGKIPDDFFKDKIDYCGLEDNIYSQLSRTMTRAVDIDFAKTPIVDILTGYTRYIEAEKKIEQLENIRKEAIEYVLKNKLYRFKYDDEELFEITTDKKAKDDLLNILNEGDNNGK